MSSERSGNKQDWRARCGYRAGVVPLPPGPALPRDAQERVALSPNSGFTPGAATGSVELRAAPQGLAARCFTASPCPAPATCRCPSWPYGKQGLARYCVGSLEKPRRSWVNPQRFLPVWPQARQLAPGTRKPSAASRVTGCPGEKAGRATGKESEGCTAPKHHAQREGRAKALSSEPPRTNQQPGKL